MTDEHMGTCIYEKGRFELRKNDHAIIDLKGDFPPIMIASNTVDDGSEPQYADRRGVLHLLNELSDNNPNEEKHWYLKEMLDKAWTQYHEQKDENEQLKHRVNVLDDQITAQGIVIEDYQNRNQKLSDENEELKKENMEYYQLVNCGNCKYHNYDWFDDGDEFEICDKGHTERLMYNKFCKEWEEL